MGIHQRTGALPNKATASSPLLKRKDSGNQKWTVTWEELPAWMQDNQFITAGYRKPTSSYGKCIYTLFYLHNESVNIWSHLLGFILFIYLGARFSWSPPFPDSLTVFDYFFFYIFIAGALVCLGFSSCFHCFSCHSERVAASWNRCDYAGITTLIVTSFFPMVYYGFHCHLLLQILYLSIITTLGAFTASVTLLKHFRTPAYRWMRTSLFIALGLFGVIPALHGVYLYGFRTSFDTISFIFVALMGASYIIGALIYGYRIPERWYPGSFNIWGASHQIFHVFVIIALLFFYVGVLNAMTFWHSTSKELCK